jgi:glyoxylase-like metal-dependent hydrolase (beta-lactamase superfamily II)
MRINFYLFIKMSPVLSIVKLDSGSNIYISDFKCFIIHTYVAPENSFGTATHIIESPNVLIVIDTQYLVPYTKEVIEYSKKLNKPIIAVIISHAHPDHYFGLTEFVKEYPSLKSFALQEVIEEIKNEGSLMLTEIKKGLGSLVPDIITIPTNAILSESSTKTELIDGIIYDFERYNKAESKEQLIISFPQVGAIIVQDLIYNGYHPWLDKYIPNWIETLTVLQNKYKDYPYVYVGHGSPSLYGSYDQMKIYLEVANNIVKNKKKKIKKSLIKAYPKLKGSKIISMYSKLLKNTEK